MRKFDVTKGCQNQSTGVLGGCYLLCIAIAYALYQTQVLSAGGPPIMGALSWLPADYHFRSITRNYYDILFIVLLSFQFMVSWEFIRSRAGRGLILAISAGTLGMALGVALGAPWPFSTSLQQLGGWNWNRMEPVFALQAGAMLLPWLLRDRSQIHIVRSPLGWAVRSAFWRWGAGLLIFSLVLAITYAHPFYGSKYYENWRITCGYLYSAYLFLGFPYALITARYRGHRYEHRVDAGFVLLLILRGMVKRIWRPGYTGLRRILNDRRNLALLRDLGVKLFFVPLMVVFLFNEFGQLSTFLGRYLDGSGRIGVHWKLSFDAAYWVLFHSLFVVDVGLGLIGYCASSRWLDNKSRSVDPTMSGWLVALICYPPFNGVANGYLPYGPTGFSTAYWIFQSVWLEVGLKTFSLVLYAVYVWATMAFGLRFSNLTHRGILTQGPYALIRHPAYACKNLAWWATSITNFNNPMQFLFLGAWNFIYYLRAMTEERHLRQDPDYRSYCKHVRHRFIPGLW